MSGQQKQQDKTEQFVEQSVDQLVDGYYVFLDKLQGWLEKADENAGPVLVNGLKSAEEFMHDLGQWTESEINLISDYVKRDVHEIALRLEKSNKSLAQWLEIEPEKVEQGVLSVLSLMTDQTRLELDKLKHLAQQQPNVWHTGEVTVAGILVCNTCGKELHYQKPGRIPPCPKCHKTEFVFKE